MDHKVIFTNGCFDILHAGHIQLLYHAKQLGGVLHVGLNSDKSVRQLKGECRPIIPQHHRFEMLASIKYVDFVHIFDELTPLELIKKIDPDIVVKGEDWDPEDVVCNGKKVITLPYRPQLSTSEIIKKIKETC